MDQPPALPPALWIPTTLLLVAMGALVRCGREVAPTRAVAATTDSSGSDGANAPLEVARPAPSPVAADPPPRLQTAGDRPTAAEASAPTSTPVTTTRPDPRVAATEAPPPPTGEGAGPPAFAAEREPGIAPLEAALASFWQPSALDLEQRIELMEQDSFLAEALELLRRAQQSSQVGHDYTWIETSHRPFLLLSRGPDVPAELLAWCDELVQVALRLESDWLRPLGLAAVAQPFALVIVPDAVGTPELQWMDAEGETWLLLAGVPREADRAVAAAHCLRRSMEAGGDGLPWWLLLGLARWAEPEATARRRFDVHVRLADLLAVEAPDDLGLRMAALQSILDQAAYRAAFLHAAGSFVEFCMDGPTDAPRREVLQDWARRRCDGLEDRSCQLLVDGLGFDGLDALEQAWLVSLRAESQTSR